MGITSILFQEISASKLEPIDSIEININSLSILFQIYWKREINTHYFYCNPLSLITEGYLRNVSRSDNNSHGFLIEKWTIIENKDLKTENR